MLDELADVEDVEAIAKSRVALKNNVTPFVLPVDGSGLAGL